MSDRGDMTEQAIQPTIEVDETYSPRQVRLCPGCGRTEQTWGAGGRGFLDDEGQTYCCGGCLAQTGCTCGRP